MYKPILISFEPRPDLRAALTQMKTDVKNIHTKMNDQQCEYAAAGATDDLRTQQLVATQANALTAIRKQITHYIIKVPLLTPSTFKPIKSLEPFMLKEDASSAVKEKWLRQSRTYYYQSKINETYRERQLSLLIPCLDEILGEVIITAGLLPSVSKMNARSHMDLLKEHLNKKYTTRRHNVHKCRQVTCSTCGKTGHSKKRCYSHTASVEVATTSNGSNENTTPL